MKLYLLILLLLNILLVSSCSQLKKKPIKISVKKIKDSIIIKRGEVLKIELPLPSTKIPFKVSCNGNNVLYYNDKNKIVAYIAESYFSKLTPYTCDYLFSKEIVKTKNKITIANILVKDRNFPSEKLRVDKKRVVLSEKDKARAAKEWALTSELYKNPISTPQFTTPFIIPLNSKITSYYGAQRVYNNMKKTQHLGTDFRAKVGVPIPAANSGKVILAKDLFYTGNTVIIDHGLGIFTVYGHLSKLKTTKGSYIPKGAILGLAGATGRVTGPHLHWGVKVNNNYIDGDSLVKTTNK